MSLLNLHMVIKCDCEMQRFATPPVPGIPPPHAVYKVDPGIGSLTSTGQSGPHPLFDFLPVSIYIYIHTCISVCGFFYSFVLAGLFFSSNMKYC